MDGSLIKYNRWPQWPYNNPQLREVSSMECVRQLGSEERTLMAAIRDLSLAIKPRNQLPG